jgi:hypothetical protein
MQINNVDIIIKNIYDFFKYFEKFRRLYIIDKKTGCWNWIGPRQNKYGRIYIKNKQLLAHRFSYMIYKGNIKNTFEVCHDCDNPLCVNPEHLSVGTHEKNIDDMLKRREQITPIIK